MPDYDRKAEPAKPIRPASPCECNQWVCTDSYAMAHVVVGGHHPHCHNRDRKLNSTDLIDGLLVRLLGPNPTLLLPTPEDQIRDA